MLSGERNPNNKKAIFLDQMLTRDENLKHEKDKFATWKEAQIAKTNQDKKVTNKVGDYIVYSNSDT